MANSNKDKLVQAAQKLVGKGQYRRAAGEYEKIVKEDPADIRSRLKLADLYYRARDPDNAVRAFAECAEQYEKQGFMQKAISVYKQVLQIMPDRPDVMAALAENYRKLGRANDALAEYTNALVLMQQANDGHGQLSIIEHMLELDPENVVDRLRLAEAYSRIGERTAAGRQLRRVADILQMVERSKDFQQCAERFMYHQPNDANMAKRLAESYLDAGKPELALARLKVAQRRAPRDLEGLALVAEAFDQLGQTHKAVIVLKEMARLYQKAGLDQERRECLSKVLEFDPADESAREALGDTAPEVTGTTIEFEIGTGMPKVSPPPSPAEQAGAPPLPQATPPKPPPPPPTQEPSEDDILDAMIRSAAGDGPITRHPLPHAAFSSQVGQYYEPQQQGTPYGTPVPGRQPPSGSQHARGPLFPGQPTRTTPPPTSPPYPPVHRDEPSWPASEPPAGPVTRERSPTPAPPPRREIRAQQVPTASLEEVDPAFDDLDWEDDEEDEDLGFEEFEDQTLVDAPFIPDDVLDDARDDEGFGWVKPADEPTPGPDAALPQLEAEPEEAPIDKTFRDELRELDFYIQNEILEEAEVLFKELVSRYGSHSQLRMREMALDELR